MSETALDSLMTYYPADEEGVMVVVARQAIHEVAGELEMLRQHTVEVNGHYQRLLSDFDKLLAYCAAANEWQQLMVAETKKLVQYPNGHLRLEGTAPCAVLTDKIQTLIEKVPLYEGPGLPTEPRPPYEQESQK